MAGRKKPNKIILFAQVDKNIHETLRRIAYYEKKSMAAVVRAMLREAIDGYLKKNKDLANKNFKEQD